MSNRTRILFHHSLDGPRFFQGNKALEALERLVRIYNRPKSRKSPSEVWVSQRQWIRLGEPPFIERALDKNNIFGPSYNYRLAKPPAKEEAQPSTPPEKPVFKSPVDRVKWLWQQLPRDVQKNCLLTVTRESRRGSWRLSQCNPSKYGWMRSTKAPAPGFVISTSDSSWTTVDDSLSAHLKASLAYHKDAKPSPPGKPKTAPPRQRNVKYIPDTSIEIPEPAGTSSGSPKMSKAPKPKLRVGIWA